MHDTALPLVGQLIVDFLDGYFQSDAGARRRMLTHGNVSGVATIIGG
jgi:hypothetical protein